MSQACDVVWLGAIRQLRGAFPFALHCSTHVLRDPHDREGRGFYSRDFVKSSGIQTFGCDVRRGWNFGRSRSTAIFTATFERCVAQPPFNGACSCCGSVPALTEGDFAMRSSWIVGLCLSMALAAVVPVHAEEMVVKPAPAADKETVEWVALSPAPGVTILLPKGWIACDPAMNAQLGNAPDPMNMRATICGSVIAGMNFQLRAANPKPLRTLAVTMLFDSAVRMTDEMITSLANNPSPEVTKRICDAVTAPFAREAQLVSCDVSQTTLGGHVAVLTTVIAIPFGIETSKFRLRVYEIAGPQGYLQFQINNPVLIQSVTDPTADEILKSITIQ